MKKNKTPVSAGGKQRSIASFFSATPKAAGESTPGKGVADAAPASAPKPRAAAAAPAKPAAENDARHAASDEKAASDQKPATPQPPKEQGHQQAAPAPPPATSPAAPAAGAAEAGAAGAKGGGKGGSLVGRRVSIFWPKEQAWFDGEIDDEDGDGRHHVAYDDGDAEWVRLAEERHKLLPAKGSTAAKRAAAKRRNVVLSDDDEDGSGSDGGDSGSDYKAESDDGDEAMEDLEDEGDGSEGDDASEDGDDDEGGGGGKRKRGGKAAPPRKRGPAAGAAPGSAGRTPMTAAPRRGASPASAAAATPGPSAGGGFGAASPFTCGGGGGDATPAASRGGSRTPGSKGLGSRLEGTPGASQGAPPPEQAVVLGVAAEAGGEAARFAAKMAERFPFLHPNRIKDAKMRRPSDPDYDPLTLHVPPSWIRDAKVTEAQQQWWRFKAANFGSVLLFKVGKFYEMFNMDAYVGVDVLNLQFMKGEQAHAGFPEAAYSAMAEQLARAGYRVVVVEQTETPEMLAARNDRRRPGEKKTNVVERQAVAVLSRGTLTDAEMTGAHPDASYVMADAEMTGAHPDASYVMAVVELEAGAGQHDRPVVGACALDAAAGRILLGSWRDDEVRLSLRTHLTALRPVELVLPRAQGGLGDTTRRLLKSALRTPQLNELTACSGPASSGEAALKALRAGGYFKAAAADGAADGAAAAAPLPPLLSDLQARLAAAPPAAAADGDVDMADGGAPQQAGEGAQQAEGGEGGRLAEAALRAMGLMVQFLRDGLLDGAVLPHARYEPLCGPGGEGQAAAPAGCDAPAYMALDGAALENLELLENSAGGTAGTLLALLDHCTTPFGRRRLRQWLVRPLFRAADIARRQDAVEELMTPLADAAGAVRRSLAGVCDMERVLARLAASAGGEGGGVGREAPHVVLYEDVSKKRVQRLVGAVRDMGAVGRALAELEKACPSSAQLSALAGGGRWDSVEGALQEMEAAADWKEAQATGRVVPSHGADEAYDAACDLVSSTEDDLDDYLTLVRQKMGCKEVKYVAQNKESHVLEVPESALGRVPSSFALVSQKKGFKRYTTDKLKTLVKALAEAHEAREDAMGGILQSLERKFVARRELWSSAVEAAAVLDALMALAGAALSAEGVMTRPRVLDAPDSDTAAPASAGRPAGPYFHARQLRHPAGVCGGAGGAFVPNDVRLGGGGPRLLLLTGPNMGGKSTLLRQVCLAAVLAQVGAWVPAEELEMTAMDGVYVRMGARDNILAGHDNILAGQSTFFVELNETAAMLHRATERSLVALDELGRGTATLDGAAIASAVLEHLAHSTRCCGLFATHYHQLSCDPAPSASAAEPAAAAADAEGAPPPAAPMHMGCAVAGSGDDSEGGGGGGAGRAQEVTFLYQLTPGACPKSYGTNVARLAGLPGPVVSRAAEISRGHEADAGAGAAALAAGAGGGYSDPLLAAALEGVRCVRRHAAGGGEGGGGLEEAQRAAREVLAAA
ncbi:MAG: muts domain V-domain-containing protein [Monoraphidium minutum]|nr:MAG: muts domain V-domain-containing protein [Monoraphidium minutum]